MTHPRRLSLIPSSHIKNDKSEAHMIYLGNIVLIDQCDVMVANLSSFRAQSQILKLFLRLGMQRLRGSKWWALLARILSYEKVSEVTWVFRDEKGGLRDERQRWVEERGLPFNLMIACPVDNFFWNHGRCFGRGFEI